MPFFISSFILISLVFVILAWRMDRKHKVTVVDWHADFDKHSSEVMMKDSRHDRY